MTAMINLAYCPLCGMRAHVEAVHETVQSRIDNNPSETVEVFTGMLIDCEKDGLFRCTRIHTKVLIVEEQFVNNGWTLVTEELPKISSLEWWDAYHGLINLNGDLHICPVWFSGDRWYSDARKGSYDVTDIMIGWKKPPELK